jgi:Flp pilus assembly pilin Flp
MSRSAHGAAGTQRFTFRRMNGESGQTSVEYALVLALIAIALVTALVAINGPFTNFVTGLASKIAGLD